MHASRILFATDFTATSAGAEAWVEDIAQRLNSRVILLHAVEPIPGGDASTDAFLTDLSEKASSTLAELSDRLEQAGLAVEARVLIKERWRAIVDTAQAEGCDLIVLGASRLTPDGRPMIGATSHKVFLTASAPVLFVPNL